MATLRLLSPLDGWATPLDEVPDPVFAERMMGDGVAIDPVGDTLFAPCDGTVVKIHAARHAITLRSAEGIELLLHIGLETVALGGEGFTALAADGDTVKVGQPLIRFDLDGLAQRAPSLLTPVIVTNPDAFAVVSRRSGCLLRVGEPFMELVPTGAAIAAAPLDGSRNVAGRRLTITHPHGLHARPAARIAAEAKRHSARTEIRVADRAANAKSPMEIMGLGVHAGTEIELAAEGLDAEAAVAALARLIASDINGAPLAPPPRSAPAPAEGDGDPRILSGVQAAPGLAVGPAARLTTLDAPIDAASAGQVEERTRLTQAGAQVRKALAAQIADLGGERRAVLEAHLELLEDDALTNAADRILAKGASAGIAWEGAVAAQIAVLQGLGDPRLAERAADLRDLEQRVLWALSGQTAPRPSLPPGSILLADDLMPSDIIGLEAGQVAGLCTVGGGPTSHVAILAASMGVPALVAAGPGVLAVADGQILVLDADAGRLDTAPTPDEIAAARTKAEALKARAAAALAAAQQPCGTADGVHIEVFANVGSAADAEAAARNGAEGCGLLRTEFLFLDRPTPPSEAEQAQAYQAVADALRGRPIIVRTLDVGGDKPAPYLALPREDNPALGVRGVRVGLRDPDLLRTQIRAILRVTPAGRCRIMVPMVASLSEFLTVRRLLDEARAELGHDAPAPLGVMIETPAAAMTADLIAAHADFLSVGSNDLAQYALAMDRGNPALAAQVDALHPAVLRLIAQAAAGAARHVRPVGVCGGLASDLAAVPILIGLGVTELSTAPARTPEVKALVRTLTLPACRALAARALGQASAQEVRALRLAPTGPFVREDTAP